MSENIWNFRGKLPVKTLIFLSLAGLLMQGCSNRFQYTQSKSRFSYYPDGKRAYSSYGKTKSYKSVKVKKGEGSAAMHRATLRPYSTFGIRYFPKIQPVGSENFGIASWYGPNFHGKKTSCGETYDMHGMTAAHKTLPMHTVVEVTHRKTGKTIKVRVNDRGPFVKGRIIDLSYAAGKALGLDKTGTAPVEVKVLSYDSYIASYADKKESAGDIAYGLQLGSYSVKESAQDVKTKAGLKYQKNVKIQSIQRGDEIIYRVVVAGFNSESSANRFKNKYGLNNAVVVPD